MDLLKDDEIAGKLRMIGPWDYDPEDKMIVRETTFKEFMEAMGFQNKRIIENIQQVLIPR